MDASVKEMQAVFISRQIKNGDYISLGTNLPVPTAGALLASFTHAPDLKINVLNYVVNLSGVQRFNYLTQIANPAVEQWAESIMSMEEQFLAVARMDLSFAGCLQVDRFGNINLIGIGEDPRHLRLHGPGAVGTSTVLATVKQFFIFLNEHSPRVFVERCDFVSAVGWGEGGADGRRRLGLPGGGPRFVITPKGILDFHPQTREMRLRYLFPGVTAEEVRASTGFPLLVAPELGTLPPPEPELLRVLRERVDPQGYLRR